MASISTTPFSLFFLIFTLGYFVALLYVVLLERRHSRHEGCSTDCVFSILVPSRNEEGVLEVCLTGLLALDYPASKFEILVVDDGSEDRTFDIASRFSGAHEGRIRVARIPDANSGRGKASALNFGYRFLRANSPFRQSTNWIIGVFDADGSPEADMLGKASAQFATQSLGGVQASVRIRNRDHSWLTRMQDVEFAGFARMTQVIRSRLTGSASLGGNGQFVRAAALEDIAVDSLERLYWNPAALTEDLDLSTRLALRNWDTYQLDTSHVWQEGVESLRALMRQRTRWAWGSLQVFSEYVLRLKILRTPGVRLRKRFDLMFNLSMFLVSPVVLLTWIISAVGFLGLVSVSSALPGSTLFLLSFGYFPVVGYGLMTTASYSKRSLLADLVGFAVYTYHWVPCLYLGIFYVATRRKPVWWKTAKSLDSPSG